MNVEVDGLIGMDEAPMVAVVTALTIRMTALAEEANMGAARNYGRDIRLAIGNRHGHHMAMMAAAVEDQSGNLLRPWRGGNKMAQEGRPGRPGRMGPAVAAVVPVVVWTTRGRLSPRTAPAQHREVRHAAVAVKQTEQSRLWISAHHGAHQEARCSGDGTVSAGAQGAALAAAWAERIVLRQTSALAAVLDEVLTEVVMAVLAAAPHAVAALQAAALRVAALCDAVPHIAVPRVAALQVAALQSEALGSVALRSAAPHGAALRSFAAAAAPQSAALPVRGAALPSGAHQATVLPAGAQPLTGAAALRVVNRVLVKSALEDPPHLLVMVAERTRWFAVATVVRGRPPADRGPNARGDL
mmetsp:Transcript_58768/g.110619  ORF Transcript_58768/g.110619 Transcript_58768/m.110619 type:complete len:357 (+) Transcript_58768:131-1201(+)